MSAFAGLFEPLALGALALPNRLVMAPMGSCLERDGMVTDDTIAYYRRRAAGGVGTITVEGALVSADTVGPELRISGDEHVAGLRRLVEALRPHGVVVGIQLLHPGRQVVAGPSVAPSPLPLHAHAPVPRALEHDEIAAIVADYARAARRAAAAGFDFVEVHGAHGYLPSAFLSPRDNRRSDGYGGDLAGRARFALEVARAIAAEVGQRLPLVWRLNGEDGLEGGFGLREAVTVAGWLADAGVAALSVSSGTWHTLHLTLAPMFQRRGHMVALAAAVRAAVDVPVMAVGRLDDPALAARVLADGAADLVVLGRGLIADPDWPRKVAEGRLEEIRPCIACNACVDLVGRGQRARCSVNPEVGRERTWRLAPAPRPRRVLVVGGGPAGLEAARVARERGHDVALWEREARVGGKLEVAGTAPSKRDVLRYRAYQERLMTALGVRTRVGVRVGAGDVARAAPDVVVVATGAAALVPPIAGADGPRVHDAQALLRGEVPVAPGDRVVVVGGSATGCETAELLAAAGARVTILELAAAVGRGIEAITRRHLVRALRGAGVRIETGARVVAIDAARGANAEAPSAAGGDAGAGSAVTVRYADGEGAEHAVAADVVALAVGWRPRGEELARELAGMELIVAGDARRPADFVAAVNAGADAGLAV